MLHQLQTEQLGRIATIGTVRIQQHHRTNGHYAILRKLRKTPRMFQTTKEQKTRKPESNSGSQQAERAAEIAL